MFFTCRLFCRLHKQEVKNIKNEKEQSVNSTNNRYQTVLQDFEVRKFGTCSAGGKMDQDFQLFQEFLQFKASRESLSATKNSTAQNSTTDREPAGAEGGNLDGM